MNHAIKIEDLDLTQDKADQLIELFKEYLLDLEFNGERIEAIECRHRDGFSPYNHNKGGIEGICYTSSLHEDTGFHKVDAILERYYQNDLKDFKEENNIKRFTSKWYDKFDEYRQNGECNTILFTCRFMMLNENTVRLLFMVNASDAPYHRGYDEFFEKDIVFSSVDNLKKKLKCLDENNFIKTFKRNVRNGW